MFAYGAYFQGVRHISRVFISTQRTAHENLSILIQCLYFACGFLSCSMGRIKILNDLARVWSCVCVIECININYKQEERYCAWMCPCVCVCVRVSMRSTWYTYVKCTSVTPVRSTRRLTFDALTPPPATIVMRAPAWSEEKKHSVRVRAGENHHEVIYVNKKTE